MVRQRRDGDVSVFAQVEFFHCFGSGLMLRPSGVCESLVVRPCRVLIHDFCSIRLPVCGASAGRFSLSKYSSNVTGQVGCRSGGMFGPRVESFVLRR
jgi:hypothetical protein